MFSKACEYGLRASIFIAKQSKQGNKVGLTEVSTNIDSPKAYTSKILQQLAKCNIIQSDKGPGGGYYIPLNEIERINLCAIVSAIDGDKVYKGCALGFPNCNDETPCSIHQQYASIRTELKNMLETTTLLKLTENLQNGLAFLKP